MDGLKRGSVVAIVAGLFVWNTCSLSADGVLDASAARGPGEKPSAAAKRKPTSKTGPDINPSGRKKKTTEVPLQIKIFHLKHRQAAEMEALLEALFLDEQPQPGVTVATPPAPPLAGKGPQAGNPVAAAAGNLPAAPMLGPAGGAGGLGGIVMPGGFMPGGGIGGGMAYGGAFGLGGRLGMGMVGGTGTPKSYRIAVDDRTQSLVVRASEPNLQIASDLVHVLDLPEGKAPPVVASLTAIKLRHAQSETLAQIIDQLGLDIHIIADSQSNTVIIRGIEPVVNETLKVLHELDVPGHTD